MFQLEKSFFFFSYVFRDENLLTDDFLLKKSHDMTLFQLKNVYWIGVHLRLQNKHEPPNNFCIFVDTQPKFG